MLDQEESFTIMCAFTLCSEKATQGYGKLTVQRTPCRNTASEDSGKAI